MRVAPEDVQDSPSDKSTGHCGRPVNNGGHAGGCSTTSPARFTTAFRLSHKDGFDRVIRSESIADKHFKIFFVRNNVLNSRLGIIASKKTLPRAVDRNRIKRTIRAIFRQHHIKALKLDIVVMVRRVDAQERGAQHDNLETLFSRIEQRCAE